jgi:hypothetical protein
MVTVMGIVQELVIKEHALCPVSNNVDNSGVEAEFIAFSGDKALAEG